MTELGRSLDRAFNKLDVSIMLPLPLDDSIPTDPQAFYEECGLITHPETRQPVKQLTPYQVETWRGVHENKRVLVVKSNKIGLSTSVLLLDFQLAVLPTANPLSTRGYDTLIIAQTVVHAQEHLKTLRKMIYSSRKYAGFLLTKPEESGWKDESSKANIIYLKNPGEPDRPSRIIALGLNNAGAIASWKNVKHVHVSDATTAEGDISEAMSYADTRLANTDGTMIIETIPSLPQGYIFELYQANNDRHGTRWKVFTIPATEAVKAGVIKQKFLDAEKASKGILYGRYYGAQFVSGDGNIFAFDAVDRCTIPYASAMQDGRKILAVDPAFASSKFGIVGAENIGGIAFVREARQFERPSPAAMVETVTRIFHQGGYSTCLVDGSQVGMLTDLGKSIRVEPVNFKEKLTEMTWSAISAINEERVRIHPDFHELLNQLKMVSFNEKGHPDKTKLSFDIGDAFLMAVNELVGAGSGVSGILMDEDGTILMSTGCSSEKSKSLGYGGVGWACLPPD